MEVYDLVRQNTILIWKYENFQMIDLDMKKCIILIWNVSFRYANVWLWYENVSF